MGNENRTKGFESMQQWIGYERTGDKEYESYSRATEQTGALGKSGYISDSPSAGTEQDIRTAQGIHSVLSKIDWQGKFLLRCVLQEILQLFPVPLA
jgi:hypothetical protein